MGTPASLAFSRMAGSTPTTLLSVRLDMASTPWERRVSAACVTSAWEVTPTASMVKPYSGAFSWYSAMVETELGSLVV